MANEYKLKEGEFSHKGKVYKSKIHAVEIPKMGVRTALEIAADKDAQAYLIKEGCIGSVLEEVDTTVKEDSSSAE